MIVLRRRKDEQGESLPESDVDRELPPSEEEPARKPDEGAEPEAAPQEVETEPASEQEVKTAEPIEQRVMAPGVRLDESEEAAAAQKLVDAKRERKLKKLRKGLAPTRGGFIAKIGAIFREKKTIDPALLDELEETLITADVGAKTVEWFITLLKEALEKDELADPDAVWSLLRAEVERVLTIEAEPWDFSKSKPFAIMVVGVNGVGKTTTIGKLASQYSGQGHKVVLAAADTFRAAAVNQREIWGRRTKCEVIRSKDAIKHAQENGADVVIADTAGRLHTKAPLMEEIKKVSRVMEKALDGAPYQILLVLDATTGQNALQQVKEFGEAIDLTGIALTKLDGTAKGGVIIGICHEYKIPVRFIGIGEAKDDLREFEVNDFVDALFYKKEEDEEE